MKFSNLAMSGVLLLSLTRCVSAAEWITAPSYFTHDPQSGARVTQYSPIGPFYSYSRSDFTTSGYRHTRSSIQAGGSVDHLHIVEEWGRPVRPYEEWRFPYRPYSAPYPLWGPQPVPGYGGGFGFGGGFGGGAFPGAGAGVGFGFGNPGGQLVVPPGSSVTGQQPWIDGHYPTYDRHDRTPYNFPYQGPYNSANGFGGADGNTGVGP